MSEGFQRIAVCSAATVEAMRRVMFRAAPRADLLEVRLDALEPGEREAISACFAAAPRPTLATCRLARDGGGWQGPEEDRVGLLESAARAGADWLDLEWGTSALNLLERDLGAARLVSWHFLEAFPEDLEALGRTLAGVRSDAVKIAAACPRARDVLSLAGLCRSLAGQGRRVLGVPVGETARWGRLWAPAWGCWGGFFLPPEGERAAVRRRGLGIPALDEAEDLYHVRQVGAQTRLFGVIGRGVEHSLSPAIHNAALREAGMDGLYLPLPFTEEDFEDLLLHAEAFPFEGLSVTTPYKEKACELVDRLEGAAAEARSLNTIRREADGTTTGFNTDGAALRELVSCRLRLAGARAVVLGAGGAARGVAQALVEAGASVLVLNRTGEKARALAEELGCRWGRLPEDQGEIVGADLLVNATPLGDRTGPGGKGVNPVSEAVLKEAGEGLVVDLVYRPRQTRLLREASRAGWKVLDGTEVLLRQAAHQFRIWTGRPADLEAMRAAL